MSGDPFSRVSPGQAFAFPARVYNSILDIISNGDAPQSASPLSQSLRPPSTIADPGATVYVNAVNRTVAYPGGANTIDKYEPAWINTRNLIAFGQGESQQQVADQSGRPENYEARKTIINSIGVNTINTGIVGIAQEAVAPGRFGRFAILGPTVAKIRPHPTIPFFSCDFFNATASDSESVLLPGTGLPQIVLKRPGVSTGLGVVMLTGQQRNDDTFLVPAGFITSQQGTQVIFDNGFFATRIESGGSPQTSSGRCIVIVRWSTTVRGDVDIIPGGIIRSGPIAGA